MTSALRDIASDETFPVDPAISGRLLDGIEAMVEHIGYAETIFYLDRCAVALQRDMEEALIKERIAV
jgi:hypothetical protein